MTRWRKEIMKDMDQLAAQELADFNLGCGECTREITKTYRSYWNDLNKKFAATYGMTVTELDQKILDNQMKAYRAGKIDWYPMYGTPY